MLSETPAGLWFVQKTWAKVGVANDATRMESRARIFFAFIVRSACGRNGLRATERPDRGFFCAELKESGLCCETGCLSPTEDTTIARVKPATRGPHSLRITRFAGKYSGYTPYHPPFPRSILH